MEPWRLLWCFYNSLALSNATSVVLLGTIIFVIPALLTLPSSPKPQLGELHTDYIELRKSKIITWILGGLTTLCSVLAILPYGIVLSQTDGETCKVTVTPAPEISWYLVLLYIITLVVLLLFGFFYVFLQDTKKKYEVLKKETKENN